MHGRGLPLEPDQAPWSSALFPSSGYCMHRHSHVESVHLYFGLENFMYCTSYSVHWSTGHWWVKYHPIPCPWHPRLHLGLALQQQCYCKAVQPQAGQDWHWKHWGAREQHLPGLGGAIVVYIYVLNKSCSEISYKNNLFNILKPSKKNCSKVLDE